MTQSSTPPANQRPTEVEIEDGAGDGPPVARDAAAAGARTRKAATSARPTPHQETANQRTTPVPATPPSNARKDRERSAGRSSPRKNPGRPTLPRPTVFRPKRNGRQSALFDATYRGRRTALGVADRRKAERLAGEWKKSIDRLLDGVVTADHLTVGQVLDAYAAWHSSNGTGNAYKTGINIRRLRPFWGRIIVSDLDPDADVHSYVEHARTDPVRRGAADSTLRDQIGTLERALRTYAAMHPEAGLPALKLTTPGRGQPRDAWFTRREVARLLWIIRGRSWVDEIQDWDRWGPTRPGEKGPLTRRGPAWTDRMRPLTRLVLLAAYSGSRLSVLLNMRWVEGDDHGHLDPSTGDFDRLGLEEVEDPGKTKPTGSLPAQAALLARLWHRADVARFGESYDGPVVHLDGESIAGGCSDRWEALRAAAQFGFHAILHTFRHSCGTWAIEGGATIDEGAAFIGIHRHTFKLTYLQYAPHFADEAAAAMSARR